MKLIFFYIVTYLSYLSIVGYGKLVQPIIKKNIYNENLEKLINFTYGVILLSILGFFFYLLSIKYLYFNIVILILGNLIYFKNYKDKKNEITNLTILLFTILGLVISKTHEDFIPYHFPFIEIISNSKPILGLGKIEINYVYTPLIAYLQKLFVLPYLEYKLLHVPIFLIFYSVILYLTKEIIFNKKMNTVFFFILIFFLLKFSRLSEYGYDHVVTFLFLIIAILYINILKNKNKNINLIICVPIFIFALSIKSTAIFFIPFFFTILIYEKNIKKNFKNNNLIYISFFLLLIISLENFMKSGCFINFIFSSCVQNENFKYSVDVNQLLELSFHVKLWAKGFYHQASDIIEDPIVYNFMINWVPNWYKVHFNYKVLEFLLILLITFIISIYINQNKEKKINKLNKKIFFSSIVSVLMWFFILPQLRFGAGLIIIFFIIMLIKLVGYNDKYYNKKIVLTFVAISFVIFNLKNINRISDELVRTDKYRFKNFPFISVFDYAKINTFEERYKKSLQKRFDN